MASEQPNPYAPPVEDEDAALFGAEEKQRAGFRDERMSVLALIGLTIVTLGLYSSIWFLRKQPFLDKLNRHMRFGRTLPIVAIAINVLGLAAAVLAEVASDSGPAGDVVYRGGGIFVLIMSFQVKSVLRAGFARYDISLPLSSLATFFFQAFYLQYKINEAADIEEGIRPNR